MRKELLMEELKKVIFNVGIGEYGIDILHVSGIENPENVVYIPNAPSCIVGVMQLRGVVIPIFSLRRKFGVEDLPKIEACSLIVTNVRDTQVGFLVDCVNEIVEVPAENIHKAPKILKGHETAYIDKIAEVSSRLVVLLRLDGIIGEEEVEIINELLEEDLI